MEIISDCGHEIEKKLCGGSRGPSASKSRPSTWQHCKLSLWFILGKHLPKAHRVNTPTMFTLPKSPHLLCRAICGLFRYFSYLWSLKHPMGCPRESSACTDKQNKPNIGRVKGMGPTRRGSGDQVMAWARICPEQKLLLFYGRSFHPITLPSLFLWQVQGKKITNKKLACKLEEVLYSLMINLIQNTFQ